MFACMHGYRVVCLTANRRVDLMETQIREFRPDLVSMMDPVRQTICAPGWQTRVPRYCPVWTA